MDENTDPGKSLGEVTLRGRVDSEPGTCCGARGTGLPSDPASQDRLSSHATATPEVTQKQASCHRMAHDPPAQRPRRRRCPKVSGPSSA